MTKYLLVITSLLLLTISCKKEKQVNMSTCNSLTSIEDFKKFLVNADANNVLVSNSQEELDEFVISFEDDSKFCIATEDILSVQKDSQHWNITFEFSDNTSISTGFLGTEFSIPEDSIFLNPFGIAPLSAIVNFKSPVDGKINIRVEGQDGQYSDILHDFNYFGRDHSIEIYGLYLDHLNTIEVTFTNQDGKE